ncbi:MAG: hypothetical protein CUN48_18460, partial [Candidatus Thermofonsia Clade 3 bacterium]
QCTEDNPVYIAYRDAVRELRDIAMGKAALFPSPDGASVPPGAAAWAPPRLLTDTSLARMLP